MRLLLIATALILLGSGSLFAQNWEPTEAQKEAAIRTANAYFQMIDAGRFETAFTIFAPSVRTRLSVDQYAQYWRDTRRRAGALIDRRYTKVTWYPKGGSEGTGLAVAIDYEGSYSRSNVYCGFVAMVEMPTGVFEVLRDDIVLLDTATLRKMPPQVRIQMFNRPGCRRFLADDH